MRLSWNEIRARAARFAEEWADARYERGETPSFSNDFFGVFDVKRRNPVFVNDTMVESDSPVNLGDRIRVGTTTLKLDPA